MSLLGTGQLSLTKVMVLVGPDCDPRDFRNVLRQIWHRFDSEDHLWLLPFAPLDTLDFTSFKMHVGSKLILDASGEIVRPNPPSVALDVERLDPRIEKWRLLDGGFLVISVRDDVRIVLQHVIAARPNVQFVT